MSSRIALLAAVSVLATAGAARAADIALEQPVAVEAVKEGWIVTLKATGTYAPKFEGTKKYGFSGFPGISIRRPGQPWKFGAPDDGFGFAVIDTPWLQIGPVARIRSERDSSDARKFRHMDDIEWGVEPGAFVEVYPLEVLRIRGELRHGVWGSDGFVGNISADYIQRIDKFTVSFGPRTEIGDSDFTNTYFGVSRREASFYGGRIRAYKADGGVKSVGVAGAVTYDWTDNWATTAFGAYNHLTGDAGKSPVAKQLGTKNSYTVGLGLAYSFGVNW
ncbi:MipA/OmpV family protein [Methylopila sp. M107]|uniref:MipA/OmpV family protein n=1 Tax=Methylopila sp. M107 TaxID=1101190 RepID=UPI00036036F4|nr:MipA/OmpV family protein [Methylopila sp. M107]